MVKTKPKKDSICLHWRLNKRRTIMIQNLNTFSQNTNGNIVAYKNPQGKYAALAQFIINNCQSQGRLYNNKIAIASSGRFAVEIAKVCQQRGINFLPLLGNYEDTNAFNQITAMGFNIDRTPSKEKASTIARIQQEGWYYFDQFNDPIVIEFYRQEAQRAVSELGRTPDIFIDFIGSGATMRGFHDVMQLSSKYAIANSSYKNNTKYLQKPYIRDISYNFNPEVIETNATAAQELAQKYQNGQFGIMGNAARTFFFSIQAAIQYLQNNPGKTVLLYWED